MRTQDEIVWTRQAVGHAVVPGRLCQQLLHVREGWRSPDRAPSSTFKAPNPGVTALKAP